MDVESPYLDDLIKAIAKTTQLEMIDVISDGENISIDTADGETIIQLTPSKSIANKKHTSTRLLNEAARLKDNKEFWHNEVYVTATLNNDSKEESTLIKSHPGDVAGIGLHRRIYLDDYRKTLYKKVRGLFEGGNK